MRFPSKSRSQRSFFLLACLLAALLAIGFVNYPPSTAAGDADSVTTLTLEGRLAVFDDAWQTINDRYYDSRFRGVDWMQQRSIFRAQAAESENARELYAILRRLLATLDDVHTRVYAPDEKFDWWNPRFISIGLTVRDVGGFPTVVRIEKSSEPDRAGIRPGDVIEQIDGVSALSLIDRRLVDRQSIGRRGSRLRAFASIFEGAPQTFVDLQWRKRNGQLREGRFERQWYGRRLGLRIRREQGKFIVAEIDAFTPTIALEFTRQLKRKLNGARGVIIDLRGNGGGEAEAMADVASNFLGPRVGLGTFTDRWGLSFNIKTRDRSLLAPEPITSTSLPLVILVSERTASAAEIFAAAMRAAGRGTSVGTETCGCVLAIRNPHELPDGGVLDVSELDYHTSAGVRLEQNGIMPDETIDTQRQDLYNHRDRTLALAIQRLSKAVR